MNDNRVSPQVNYDDYLDKYMMICRWHDHGFYIYLSDDLLDWGTGVMLVAEPTGEDYLYPSLVGLNGSDKDGDQNYDLYFCHTPDEGNPGTHKLRRAWVTFFN
jgi:hypothetical protein